MLSVAYAPVAHPICVDCPDDLKIEDWAKTGPESVVLNCMFGDDGFVNVYGRPQLRLTVDDVPNGINHAFDYGVIEPREIAQLTGFRLDTLEAADGYGNPTRVVSRDELDDDSRESWECAVEYLLLYVSENVCEQIQNDRIGEGL